MFYRCLFDLFNCVSPLDFRDAVNDYYSKPHKIGKSENPILDALCSQAMSVDDLYKIAQKKSKDKSPSV